jgi:glycosyltransferase involved in cell wall biosynthesis
MRTDLTVLIPVCNEEQNLRLNLPILEKVIGDCTAGYEILVIDDGSSDSSRQVVAEAIKKNPKIRLVRHSRNLGPGAAIPTGIFWSRAEWIMLIPADLACEPNEICEFYKARRGVDLVVGLRSDRSDYSAWRRFLSMAYIGLLRGLTQTTVEQFNYLQLFKRELFNSLPLFSRGVFVTAEIILRAEKAGFKLTQFPMTYRARTTGKARGANPRAIARCALEMTGYFAGQ